MIRWFFCAFLKWFPACGSHTVNKSVFFRAPLRCLSVFWLSSRLSLSSVSCSLSLHVPLTLRRRVLMSAEWIHSYAVRACVWALEKPWELHLLCKCKPLIDCWARSLSFSAWTLPSAGSQRPCQGNVYPAHRHSHTLTAPSSHSLSGQGWHRAKVRICTAPPLLLPWCLIVEHFSDATSLFFQVNNSVSYKTQRFLNWKI